MKKKVLFGTAVLCFLLFSSFFVSGAADVGYILKQKSLTNKEITDIFKESNLTYEIILDTNVAKANLSKYRFLFVDDARLPVTRRIPIYNYPSIIMNSLYGYDWGLSDRDGISQFTSNAPISIMVNGTVVQVYTAARVSIGGDYIDTFYIDDLNKANLTSIARQFIGDGPSNTPIYEFGDVISYANANTSLIGGKKTKGKICFFGIPETKFWTDDAKSLFLDCLGFVSNKCSRDSDCGPVKNSTAFCKGNNVYKNITSQTCILPGTPKSDCIASTVTTNIQNCSDGCSNGQCVIFTCHNNSECDDNNTKTEDVCMNASTIYSHCVHNNITCTSNLDCGTNFYSGNFCVGKNVTKNFTSFTCLNPGTSLSSCSVNTASILNRTCLDTCQNGSCFGVTCYQDSDCGTNSYGNSFCIGKNVTKNFTSFTCLNPGTISSSCSSNTIPILNRTCSDTCNNGNCVNITCNQDSDCGTNTLTGVFCSGKNIVKNFVNYTCNNAGTTTSGCSNLSGTLTLQTCAQTCWSGACTFANINCTQDSDCNDYNARTVDSCVNPNTTASFCRNTEVNCLNDLDCGFSGFMGAEFCVGKDVAKYFKNSTCNNAGTLFSSCSILVFPKIVQTCLSNCINGTCINSVCYNNSDCNDNNMSTTDTCINPGTVSSYCKHDSIRCSSNMDCGMGAWLSDKYCVGSDVFQNMSAIQCFNPGLISSYCGTNTITNFLEHCSQLCVNGSCKGVTCSQNSDCGANTMTSAYCSGNNIVRNYVNYTCNNAGTTISGCSNSSGTIIIQTCAQTCSSGACTNNQINCTRDLDCNDYNARTVDICVNPNTTASFCRNTEVNCLNDLDCGFSGFIQSEFCSNDDVFKYYKNSTCNNAGTLNSNCVISVSPRFIQDCDDSDSATIDSCLNGTCEHKRITCDDNDDCGASVLVNNFCQSSDLWSNMSVPSCINPGTSFSYCSSNNTKVFNKTCSFGCLGSSCVGGNHDVEISLNQENSVNGIKITDSSGNNSLMGSIVNLTRFNIYRLFVNVSNKGNFGENVSLIADSCFSGASFSDITNLLAGKSTLRGSLSPYTNITCLPGLYNLTFSANIIGQVDANPSDNSRTRTVRVVQDTPICSQDSDCGNRIWTNPPYCTGNNIFTSIVNFTCVNPGTTSSSCINSTIPIQIGQCQTGCLNGECVC